VVAAQADPAGSVVAVTQQQVVVPWKLTSDQHRLDAFVWCLSRWVTAGYQVRVAQTCDDVWCKAAALTRAVAESQPVFLMADADVVVDPAAVADAVQAVSDGAAWAIPHWRVHRLTEAATARLIADGLGEWQRDDHAREPYVGTGTGGVVAVRAEVARDCPMDGRFLDWGGEDHSWGYALDRLHGEPYRPARVMEAIAQSREPPAAFDLIHLYHPQPASRPTMFGSLENEQLRKRYWEAWSTHDEVGMRQLVEEGRVWASNGSN
jgi:hypothetical protein